MSTEEERTIKIHPAVYQELQYMVDLHKEHGAPNQMESVAELVAFVLATVADGSRRPGSWERQCLYPMGIIAECPETEEYRADYGSPKA